MFWKRRKAPKSNARILMWMSDRACRRVLASEVGRMVAARQPVFMITHFSATHIWVGDLLKDHGLPSNLISDPADLAADRLLEFCRDGSVTLIPFPVLRLRPDSPMDPASGPDNAVILVPEIHPTRDRDEEVEAFATGLPLQTSLTCHVSLESPLMKRFGGPRMIEMMKRLGADENEPLEHPWLLKSIISAQKKVGKAARQDTPADSQDQWFEINAPQFVTKD